MRQVLLQLRIRRIPRKLIRRHVNAKAWVEAALNQEIPESEKMNAAAKKRFVTQLGMNNSQRGTKEIMVAFWNDCRGVSGVYAPLRSVSG